MELVIRDLSKTYRNGTRALNDVSLDIPKGIPDRVHPWSAAAELDGERATLLTRVAVAMYLLRDHIGEGPVNTALRRYLEKYRAVGPPIPDGPRSPCRTARGIDPWRKLIDRQRDDNVVEVHGREVVGRVGIADRVSPTNDRSTEDACRT